MQFGFENNLVVWFIKEILAAQNLPEENGKGK